MSEPFRVHLFTLTPRSEASEHVYAGNLRTALMDRDVEFVNDWRAADVVHCFEVNFYTGNVLTAFNYPTLVRILYSETPVVVSTDDLYFTGDPTLTIHPHLYSLNQYTQCLLFAHVEGIVAISDSVRENLLPHVDPSILHVVRHGVDDRYRVKSVETREQFVLHVSLVSPRKNPKAVVETARRLDVPVKIAGSGWDEHVPDTPAFDNVETLGYVPENELIDLYRRAAVFYFPSLHEGFGLPILEAMAAGCAVVTSDVYAIPEVTGEAAVLCNPHDVDAHVENITELSDGEDQRQALASRAIRRAAEFTWEKTATETEHVYREILDGD